jgi:DNA-nicking Smr family endonuclease
VESELDLHGLIVTEARLEMIRFLRDCQLMGGGCVRIIHGKGHGSLQKQPILKNKVNKWLRQYDAVLAFCSARNSDGGTGAVYVLVQRKH